MESNNEKTKQISAMSFFIDGICCVIVRNSKLKALNALVNVWAPDKLPLNAVDFHKTVSEAAEVCTSGADLELYLLKGLEKDPNIEWFKKVLESYKRRFAKKIKFEAETIEWLIKEAKENRNIRQLEYEKFDNHEDGEAVAAWDHTIEWLTSKTRL